MGAGVLGPEVAEGLFSFVACSKQNHTVFYQVIVWEISGFIGHDSADVIMSELSFPSVLFCSCHCMLYLLVPGVSGLYRDTSINHSFLTGPFCFKGRCGRRAVPCWDLADGLPQPHSQWKELRMRRLSDLASVSSCWWSLNRGHPCHS